MANALFQRLDNPLASPAPDLALSLSTGDTAQAAPMRLDMTLIDTMAGFEALEAEWTSLLARSLQPHQVFQTFNWHWHWCQHYAARPGIRGATLAIVTGRRAGRLELILPLAMTRIAGLRQLSWMGEPVSQYGDAIAAPEAADLATLAAAFDFAVKATGADVANLRKVRADAQIAPLLVARHADIIDSEEAPYMSLANAPDYEAYESRAPSKRRKNRRRHMRRLEERGSVVFEQLSGTDLAAHLADYAIRLKRAQLKGKGGVAPTLADPRFAAFFADAAHSRGRPVGCQVMALRSGNEIAAMQIVLDHGTHRFLHVAVFAGKFEKCGVGGLLLEHAIANCFASGITTFDLLAPKHEYKMDFADGTVLVNDHAVGLTFAGRVYVRGILGMRANVKTAIESLPAPARRVVGDAIARVRRRA
ncbi:MAG: GNAT family N-acetyltransferase [Hyphomicrobiaceae bacterium]